MLLSGSRSALSRGVLDQIRGCRLLDFSLVLVVGSWLYPIQTRFKGLRLFLIPFSLFSNLLHMYYVHMVKIHESAIRKHACFTKETSHIK